MTPGFDWDPVKNEINEEKHGIRLDAVTRVFKDPKRIDMDNTRPEFDEERRKTIGRVGTSLVAVIYTVRGDRIRIISAWKAGANERREYRQG